MLKIVNETGNGADTKIFDPKTGRDLTKIIPVDEIRIAIDARDVTIRASIMMTRLEIEGDVRWFLPHAHADEAIESVRLRNGRTITFNTDGSVTFSDRPEEGTYLCGGDPMVPEEPEVTGTPNTTKKRR